MNRKLFFSFILILSLSIFGCKKNPFDYRTKYLGDYDFTVSYTSWIYGGTVTSGAYYKTGRVEYGEKGQIKIIIDANTPQYYNVFDIDRNGTLTGEGGYSSGEFESRNKVHLRFSRNGLGGGGSQDIIGTKK